MDAALSAAFPRWFPADDYAVLERTREELAFRCLALTDDNPALLERAQECRQQVLQLLSPPSMRPGPEQATRRLRQAFERNCVALELRGISTPEQASAYAYYTRLAYLEDHKEPTK